MLVLFIKIYQLTVIPGKTTYMLPTSWNINTKSVKYISSKIYSKAKLQNILVLAKYLPLITMTIKSKIDSY